MKRRDLLAGAGALSLAACSSPQESGESSGAGQEKFAWKMVTTWPPDFPGLGTGAARLADYVTRASGGRLTVTVYAGGELVPPMEVFDTVQRGNAEMGHGAGYYWKGKSQAAQIFTAVPFGMNVLELNGWFYFGNGLELYREVYEPFGLVPFPAGNTGVQMGGWFNREIKSVADLKGLKMRIPGFGGEVLKRLGGTPVLLSGGEIFTALQTGSIDATEWVGPYNDMSFGLHKAARFYYGPGWHEPGPALECVVNKSAWESLPTDLQIIVEMACSAINDQMMAEYTARNAASLKQLREQTEVEVREFPNDVMAALKEISSQVMDEIADGDPVFRKVYTAYQEFAATARPWTRMSEHAMLDARAI